MLQIIYFLHSKKFLLPERYPGDKRIFSVIIPKLCVVLRCFFSYLIPFYVPIFLYKRSTSRRCQKQFTPTTELQARKALKRSPNLAKYKNLNIYIRANLILPQVWKIFVGQRDCISYNRLLMAGKRNNYARCIFNNFYNIAQLSQWFALNIPYRISHSVSSMPLQRT